MDSNQPDSLCKNPQRSTLSQQTTIAKQDLIQYVFYYILHEILDILILFLHSDKLGFCITKLALDSVITITIIAFRARVNHIQINILLTITKVTSLILIVSIGYDIILLLVFIQEINEIQEKKREYLIQRMFSKLIALIVVILISSMLDIVIILFTLLLDSVRLFFYFQAQKILLNDQSICIQSKTPRENLSFYFKDNSWNNKIQNMPIAVIILNTQDFQINFSNQICFAYFNQQCETREQLENFLLDKLQFKIIGHSENQQQIKTSQKIARKWMEHKIQIEEQDEIILESQTTLRSILRNQLESQQSDKISLELYCDHIWDQNNQSIYTALVKLNLEDSEILLTILDITQQYIMQEELIQDQFKKQIVQSFSHELRTPLNSACNFLQCCFSDRSISSATKQNFLEPAYNALRLQSHLINDIIDFNCLYVHDIELDFQEFLIKDLIDEVNSLFKSSIEMKNLALYVDLQDNSVQTLNTDFSRLMQIIVNILQNSIKYSNSGVIVLKVTSLPQRKIKFSIQDEGIGISEDRFVQIQQMLSVIENKSGLTKFKTWHGFGLLVSQMLLSKLCPSDYKSLLIKSQGRDKGTKISFYIQNRVNTVSSVSSSGYKRQNTLRQLSKLKASFQSATNPISINGTMIQISDMMASNRKLNWLQNGTIKSDENSLFTESFPINDLDNKMNELNHVQPALITEIVKIQNSISPETYIVESPNSKSVRDMQNSKLLSYKKIKLKDDYDSDNLLKSIFKKRRCSCKKILSVDDEIFNQKSIQCLLSQQGFEAILAFNGEEAIKTIQEIEKCSSNCNLFMVILMDYQMPIMDGIQATQKLRKLMQQKSIPQIHVIGLTAFNSKKDIQNCIEAGMSDVLSKPLKMKEFFDILNLL